MSAYDILSSRGVTRLCHFTKLQSFTHILPHQKEFYRVIPLGRILKMY